MKYAQKTPQQWRDAITFWTLRATRARSVNSKIHCITQKQRCEEALENLTGETIGEGILTDSPAPNEEENATN